MTIYLFTVFVLVEDCLSLMLSASACSNMCVFILFQTYTYSIPVKLINVIYLSMTITSFQLRAFKHSFEYK